MFYVNYVGSDVSSVVDTKDLVEEYYTNAQIKEFRKSGIIILPQTSQMDMFELAKHYLRLLENIDSKDNKVISDIVSYAEGKITDASLVDLSVVKDVSRLEEYRSELIDFRYSARDKSIGHRDLNHALLKSIKQLMSLVDKHEGMGYYEGSAEYEQEYAQLSEKILELGKSMCETCKVQLDGVLNWVELSFELIDISLYLS